MTDIAHSQSDLASMIWRCEEERGYCRVWAYRRGIVTLMLAADEAFPDHQLYDRRAASTAELACKIWNAVCPGKTRGSLVVTIPGNEAVDRMLDHDNIVCVVQVHRE